MRRRAAEALLALAAAALPAMTAAPAAPDPIAALDRELAAVVEDARHPLASLSVLAIRDGRVAYHRQFGRRAIDPEDRARDLPADADTLYRAASLSKLVTAVAAMRLVEEGRLALDADVGDALGWPLRNPAFPEVPVTLRHLLSHTSSLRDDGGYSWAADVSLREVLVPGGRHFGTGAAWSADAPPGAWFRYANLPWGVVATAMERATGERFDRLVRRLVLDPLGIRGGFEPAAFAPVERDNLATLYRKRRDEGGREVWDPAGPWVAQVDDVRRTPPSPRAGPDYAIGTNGTVFGPQGGLRISADGMGRVLLMLMHGGVLDGQRVLSRASVDAMLARQWQHDRRDGNGETAFGARTRYFNAWGLGVQHFLDIAAPGHGDRLVAGGGVTGVGHIGEAWGLTSLAMFDPVARDGIVFLSGGTGFDPATTPGAWSGHYRYEERVVTAVWHAVIRRRPPPAPAE